MKKYWNKIIHADALLFLKKLKPQSIDMVLTDPPYFLDKMDQNWSPSQVHSQKNQQIVASLPAGMKFSRKQGKQFYEWYFKISKELFRVLKPGGFFFSFSSPRLYHRMACAVDDAGFELRDCFIWLYTQNQAKAMSLHHFINKKPLSSREKSRLNKTLKGWKTPQVKSCYEPIAMAQKPLDKTYLKNFVQHGVSLINTQVKQGVLQNMFASNVVTHQYMSPKLDEVFLAEKPKKNEKGWFNHHKTVKPLSVCRYLISLAAQKGSVVLDPFIGSGTTAVACRELGRNFIGVELHQQYIDIALKRLKTK